MKKSDLVRRMEHEHPLLVLTTGSLNVNLGCALEGNDAEISAAIEGVRDVVRLAVQIKEKRARAAWPIYRRSYLALFDRETLDCIICPRISHVEHVPPDPPTLIFISTADSESLPASPLAQSVATKLLGDEKRF
ncbi:hypothetical protein BX616_010681 [Lobosporangium transversale]|nr:hypothetical protein BX616_010681 [Lobosporangium transversale]